MTNETLPIEASEMFSPKKYPTDVRPIAHILDARKKMRHVSFVFVLARPATIGMNALTEGMSLPKKIHHIPR